MMASTRAELLRLLRWPAVWVLGGLWLALNLIFGYLFTYLSYRSEGGVGFTEQVADAATSQTLLAQVLPDQVPVVLVEGLPMFGGALLLIMGALTIGSGYGWGSWKTVFTAGPRRLTALTGTLAALGLILVGLMLATLVLDVGASLTVAAVESQPVHWPGLLDTVRSVGAGTLIGGMWMAAGVLLGTLVRGPALSVGLGLVWALVVENLLRGVASLLGPVEAVTDVLPGTAAGSLAGALGGLTEGEVGGTPGVNTVLGGGVATALLAGYVLVFILVSGWLTARRDLAG